MLLVVIGGGLAGLAALPRGASACNSTDCAQGSPANITNDSYFYGQSPAVYPSRKSHWCRVEDGCQCYHHRLLIWHVLHSQHQWPNIMGRRVYQSPEPSRANDPRGEGNY